jgi:hypothetical protein
LKKVGYCQILKVKSLTRRNDIRTIDSIFGNLLIFEFIVPKSNLSCNIKIIIINAYDGINVYILHIAACKFTTIIISIIKAIPKFIEINKFDIAYFNS